MVLFEKRTIKAGELTFCYAELGHVNTTRVSLLLLHGFANDKYSWGPYAVHLPGGVHVVALDLPGHGASTKPDMSTFDFTDFAKAVDTFVEAVFPRNHCLHVIGQSMGGVIAVDYAARRPDRISHLTLICPSMKTPVKSEFRTIYETTGKSLWFPETLDEFKKMQTFCYHKPNLDVMDAIQVEMLDLMKTRYPYIKELYQKLISDASRNIVEEKAPHIKVPVLVVWGQNDRALDVSGAEVLEKIIPGCRVEIFPECGHTVNKEQVELLVKVTMDFHATCQERNDIAEVL